MCKPCMLLALILAAACGNAAAEPAAETKPAAPAPATRWTADQNMLMFFQAVQEISRGLPCAVTDRQVVETALARGVAALDRYSQYLSPEEFAAFRAAQQPGFSGVGMDVLFRADDYPECAPEPGGAAARAGLAPGDRLIAVEGRDVAGLSLALVATLVRGPEGSAVTLTVQDAEGGNRRSVRIYREWTDLKSVEVTETNGCTVVRLSSFTNRTTDELKETMARKKPKRALVLDLRGNAGGSLLDAVDAARLFLPDGSHVLTVRTRDGEKHYDCAQAGAFCTVPIYTLQDNRTASAAEVFIGALTRNGRAVSMGTRTFGKGRTQRVIALMDGSGLILTDGDLILPGGEAYDGIGLDPEVAIPPGRMALVVYLDEIEKRENPAGTAGESKQRNGG